MTKVSDIANIIEVFAPLQLCFDGDNSGLCVGNMSNSVSGIVVCEDATLNVLKEAVSCNCNLVISHHPPIFTKAKRFLTGSQDCDIINYALCNNLNLYSAHTNLDACADGINCRLCEMFGLEVLSGDGEFWRIAKAKQIFTLKQFEQMVAKVLEDCHTKTVGKLDALCQKIAVASGSGGRD
ncbi:MAG: Nif3-like dinuclear metal center hexameric protein, partial [Clostridia bacterium]